MAKSHLKMTTTNHLKPGKLFSQQLTLKVVFFTKVSTDNAKFEKTVTKHIWSDYIEFAEDARHAKRYAELYRIRKEKIERVFADAKEKYGMRYTLYRGLETVRKTL